MITHNSIPSDRANSIAIMNMANAFSKIMEVELVFPYRRMEHNNCPNFNLYENWHENKEELFKFYNLEQRFIVNRYNTFDLLPYVKNPYFNLIIFYIQNVWFSFLATFFSIQKDNDMYYTRDLITSITLALFKPFLKNKKVIMEIQEFPEGLMLKLMRFAYNKNTLLIVLNEPTKKYFVSRGFNEKKIIILPSGVNLDVFR